MRVSATAPGKIILLGEYAVLEGAPSVAIAVDRGVRVDLVSTQESVCTVSTTPLVEQPCEFKVGADGSLQWLNDAGQAGGFAFFSTVMTQISSLAGLSRLSECTFSVKLDSSMLFHGTGSADSSKLGLGSSAALTVALALSFREFSGLPRLPRERWLPVLLDAHRAHQSGRGSGVDLATSLYGGSVVYELLGDGSRVGHVVLPSDLCYRFVWSGQPASTSGYLQKLARWKEEKSIIYNSLVNNMRRVSTSAIAAAREDDCDRFLDAVNEYARCLDNLGEQTEIEIYSPPHRALSSLAIDSGLVYKPCGAGGGDLGVVMGTDDDRINRFIAQAEDAGYPSIDISIDPEGARTIRSF